MVTAEAPCAPNTSIAAPAIRPQIFMRLPLKEKENEYWR
jgi:hypothetical protein